MRRGAGIVGDDHPQRHPRRVLLYRAAPPSRGTRLTLPRPTVETGFDAEDRAVVPGGATAFSFARDDGRRSIRSGPAVDRPGPTRPGRTPTDPQERPDVRVLNEVLAANAAYAESFGTKGDLALPPARRSRS